MPALRSQTSNTLRPLTKRRGSTLGAALVAALAACGCPACQGGDAANPQAGAASGAQGGAPALGNGGAPAGEAGSGGAAGSLGAPHFETHFTDLSQVRQAPKAELLPGATATVVSAPGAEDGHALQLRVPGDPALEAGDHVGPGAHAIEVVAQGGAQLYGRYEMRVRFAKCARDEELVNGLFTYFNDGSDGDDDGIGDNSEIDIEVLCGEPHLLWLTVWTDYQEPEFRKSTRVIDLRDGSFRDSPLGTSEYGALTTGGVLPGLALPEFAAATEFYQLGFEWRADSVRYFIVLDGEERDLWELQGEQFVPQRPAEFLVNLWHAGSHWSAGGAADYPEGAAALEVDWLRIWR